MHILRARWRALLIIKLVYALFISLPIEKILPPIANEILSRARCPVDVLHLNLDDFIFQASESAIQISNLNDHNIILGAFLFILRNLEQYV